MTPIPHPPGAGLRTLLLDIDGTLVDSNDAHTRAWVGALAEHGYVVPFEQIRPLIGMGGDKVLPDLTGLDPESGEAERISTARSELFLRELPSLRPMPGTRLLLERSRDEGLELIVATSAKSNEVRALLEQAGVSDLIALASSADDARSSKPDPDIVQAALRLNGSHPSHSVMLGDTPYDVQAATRARVPIIALRCGGWWGDEAFEGSVGIYDDPADLHAQFDRSPLGIALARAGR